MNTSRPWILAGALALALATAGCWKAPAPTAPSAAPPTPPSVVPYDSLPAEAQAFVVLANQHRVAIGLAPLQWDSQVAGVARAHSVDMATRGYFSHVDPEGNSPFDRLDQAGIPWSAAGENIAAGYTTGQSVYDAWMSSPGHRANLENSTFTRHGLGLFQNRWTHMFYTPRVGVP